MEQEIRFCTTSDGVSIAYAALGSGPPLVYVNGWPGNLAMEWEQPFLREFIELFAGNFTFVRYDMRNSGLSGRTDDDDMSLGRLVADLEAVVDHLGLDQFALLSLGLLGAPVAVTYASEHASRVTRLAALSPFVGGSRLMTEAQFKALRSYVEAFGQLVTPDTFRDPERHGVNMKRVGEASAIHGRSAPRETIAHLLETLYRTDLTDQLDRLDLPVLVLHGSGDGTVAREASREFASRLRNAWFVPYEGAGAAAWADAEVILPQIFDFLGEEAPVFASKQAAQSLGSMATILFTDMAYSTALTQRLGDTTAQELVRAHDGIVREALATHGGTEVKHTGDGIMASFPTASGAIECAIAIQRAVTSSDEGELRLRIGVNAGEPVVEESDLFGTAVQLARRLCDQAQPGQILVSNVVRELAAGKGFLFSDTGEVVLKGFEEPVRLYEVRWDDHA
jgi:class 3 adenylate cyclase/pimeloyl-ACP methyl ester carboxylesterase